MYFQFIVLVLTCAWIYLGTLKGRQNKELPPVRRIAGLDALEEAVGRATELDKPVYITPGGGGLQDEGSVQTLAGLSIMEHTVRMCARYKAPFWISMRAAETYAVAEEMVRGALAQEGMLELYRDDTVEYYSSEQFAFAMGTLSRMERDGVAAAVLVGFFQAESLLLAEGSAQHGAITIGGCARTSQIPFFVVACDYVLIGEEMIIGGAYLSKDSSQLWAIWAQDGVKLAGVLFLLIGAILYSMGNPSFSNLVRW